MNYLVKTKTKTLRAKVTKLDLGFSIQIDGQSFFVPESTAFNTRQVYCVEEKDGAYVFALRGQDISFQCQDPRAFSRSETSHSQSNKLVATMPGRVVKISIQKGQVLSKGDSVLVLEAMKMENELKALHNCTVKNVLVQEGQAVASSQLLVEFDV